MRTTLTAAVLVLAMASCVFRRAVIPVSPTRFTAGEQCFQACRERDLSDADEVDCVLRCPGAVASAQSCHDEKDLCASESRATPATKSILAVGLIVGLIATAALVIAWQLDGGGYK